MKTFDLVNLLLNMTCTVEANTRHDAQGYAQGYAMDLADSDSTFNENVYWLVRRDYHNVEGFTDISSPVKTCDAVHNGLAETTKDLRNNTPMLCNDAAPSQVCPKCNDAFDWNAKGSGHQVHDYFELIFCSYACSHDYSFDYIKETAPDTETANEIIEGI